MSIVIPDCTSCKNLTDKNEKGQFCCKAFPYGIPKDYFGEKLMSEIFSNVQIILSLMKNSFKPPTAAKTVYRIITGGV